jgi:hypothetical protein
MSTLEWLVRNNSIQINGSYLRIVRPTDIPEWLSAPLMQGDKEAWECFETLDYAGRLANKFEQQALVTLGLEGEKFVIEYLKSQIPSEYHDEIAHVSLMDDSLGYDIVTPNPDDLASRLFLEVKTSSRPGPNFSCFLSRNEYSVGKNQSWRLLLVRKQNSGFEILGSITRDKFIDAVPMDLDPMVRWESLRLNLERSMFQNNSEIS